MGQKKKKNKKMLAKERQPTTVERLSKRVFFFLCVRGGELQ
jgi:hypothetical protein